MFFGLLFFFNLHVLFIKLQKEKKISLINSFSWLILYLYKQSFLLRIIQKNYVDFV